MSSDSSKISSLAERKSLFIGLFLGLVNKEKDEYLKLAPNPYLFSDLSDVSLGRNDVKVKGAGQAGKDKMKVGSLSDFRSIFQ